VSPSRARSATLALLVFGYGCLWLSTGRSSSSRSFDPLAPAARFVEQAIETGRYADALPVALRLRDSATPPNEPQIWYWIAEIYHGLDRPREEAGAWDTFVSMTAAAPAACPEWPQAHARAGHEDAALRAYEQCVAFAPDDPERLIDLADALASRRRMDAARAAYARAAALDHTDTRSALRLRERKPGESR
jgi:tetratricopeptide (TPR) repeat protein